MGSTNTRMSPRQKMINLMYIVLTAMLALNVSSDVLDGFTQVENGLSRSNTNVDSRNSMILAQLEAFAAQNPEKGRQWADKASEVRRHTMDVYNMIDSIKLLIVRQADGDDGDPSNILNRDDLEASSVVMLATGRKQGERLRLRVDDYREYILSLIPDEVKKANVNEALSTAPVRRDGTVNPQSWEEAKFESQPVVAAVTLLSKLQNDVLYAEGEALSTLLSQVDAGDVRVNELNAFVIPSSRLVMRGGKYSANIVLAAIDTTARPTVYINGKALGSQLYEQTVGATGSFTYKGYLEVPHGDGTVTRHDFESDYTVIEPMATVSATLMNVLYAGIDNPMSISVPGVAMKDISATMTNGSLTRSGDSWMARPQGVGQNAIVTVTATIDGRPTTVAQTTFRVRKLPNPTAYIAFRDAQGNVDHYKGGRPGIAKAALMAAEGLEAAIDDGLLDTKFQVISFETISFDSMGNAMPEVSDGAKFSDRQKRVFRSLSRGKSFFISRIRAKGPDGLVRDLSPMEVSVN